MRSLDVVAGVLAREARLLARVGSDDDAAAARALAAALRDRDRVARLVEGLISREPRNEVQIPA